MSLFDPSFASGGSVSPSTNASQTNLNLGFLGEGGALKQTLRVNVGCHEIAGTTQVEALGTAEVTASDRSKVYAWQDASVTARGSSIIIARDTAEITAQEYSSVVASDKVKVHATDNTVVEALGTSTVRAEGNAHVKALENSTVYASGNSTVEAASLTGCTIYLSDKAQVVAKTGKAKVVDTKTLGL